MNKAGTYILIPSALVNIRSFRVFEALMLEFSLIIFFFSIPSFFIPQATTTTTNPREHSILHKIYPWYNKRYKWNWGLISGEMFLQIAKFLAKAVTLVITMSASVESSDSTGNWKIVKQWDNFRILNATFEMSWSSAIFQTRIRYLFWSQFNFLNALHYSTTLLIFTGKL